jgi:hypothetical protein
MSIFEKIPKPVWSILALFVFSRVILGVLGIVTHKYPELMCGKCSVLNQTWAPGGMWLDVWEKWDSAAYIGIAHDGYSSETKLFNEASVQASRLFFPVNYVYFPLYPVLMKSLSIVTGINISWSGWLISNLFLIASAFMLYKLASLDFNENESFKVVKYLYLLPVSFLFSAVLSESLFLFLLISSFYFARRKKWFLSGLFGFFLSLTRSIGVVVVLPLVVEYLLSINFKLTKIKQNIGFLFLPILGTILFAVFNKYLTGDFFGFIHMEALWGRQPGNPISILISNLVYGWRSPAFYSLILLILLFYSLNKIRLSYWVLFLILFLIPLSTGLLSIFRYTVVIFPLYFILAKIASRRILDIVLTVVLIILQIYLFIGWQTGLLLTV